MKMDLLTYLEHYLYNPHKRIDRITRRGYSDATKENQVAQKDNFLNIGWFSSGDTVIMKYYIQTTYEDSPYYDAVVYQYLPLDQQEDKTPKEWEKILTDPTDTKYDRVIEIASERYHELLDKGIQPRQHAVVKVCLE